MRLSFHPGEFGRRLRLDVERWALKSQAQRSYFIVDLDTLPDCYLQIVRLNGRLHVEIGSVDWLTGETRLSPAVCDRLSELGFVRHSETGNFLRHVPPAHPQDLAHWVPFWLLAAYADLPQMDWAAGRGFVLDCGFPNLFDRDEYRRWMEDFLAFDLGDDNPDVIFATRLWNEALARGEGPNGIDDGWEGLLMLLGLPEGWTPDLPRSVRPPGPPNGLDSEAFS